MSTNGTAPVSLAKIRSTLRKAGIKASKSHTTRIRGLHHRSDGYEVTARHYPTEHVVIYFWSDDGAQTQIAKARAAQMMEAAASALRELGLKVERTTDRELRIDL